jgi:uncharacterized protein YdeI (YjbR/CyaY-like superfamily)
MPRNKKVDDFLKKKNHPMTKEIQRVREIILAADSRMEEDIKWSSPTFIYKGNMASYFMNAKEFVSLLFHTGSKIPDKSGLLEGEGKLARVARFTDMKDIEKKKKKLEGIVKAWMKMQDEK